MLSRSGGVCAAGLACSPHTWACMAEQVHLSIVLRAECCRTQRRPPHLLCRCNSCDLVRPWALPAFTICRQRSIRQILDPQHSAAVTHRKHAQHKNSLCCRPSCTCAWPRCRPLPVYCISVGLTGHRPPQSPPAPPNGRCTGSPTSEAAHRPCAGQMQGGRWPSSADMLRGCAEAGRRGAREGGPWGGRRGGGRQGGAGVVSAADGGERRAGGGEPVDRGVDLLYSVECGCRT